MKPEIHPNYKEVSINCACGAVYDTRSTKEYAIDICSACHPFFTGKAKLIDTEGRIDRFRKKYQSGNKKS
ncbi:MAG TPA: 50S ribosomal protein L31 [Myxococcota bacterium]|nr:50S ribosomal protein L31 [Myxococcota bacterium]